MTEAQRESLCALIRQAGAHAQALRDAGLQVDKKARQDFVSQADLAVEQEIKGWLQAHFPEEGFLGEESGFEGDDQTVWVLDPVDGTTNFILGMDYWCISLARVCQGELSLGIIYAPDRDEFFFAARGEGAYLNGQRLTLRGARQMRCDRCRVKCKARGDCGDASDDRCRRHARQPQVADHKLSAARHKRAAQGKNHPWFHPRLRHNHSARRTYRNIGKHHRPDGF